MTPSETPPTPPPPEAKRESLIRWKALLPTLIVLAVFGIFFRFFLDGFVRRGIEKAGTATNGAKVEVDGVSISFLHASVALRGLHVADPAEPMINRVEVGSMRFHLAAKPLFWRKFIVEDASIDGIRTGTPRTRSGALPKSAAVAAKADGGKGKPKEPSAGAALGKLAFGNLKDQYDPKKMLRPENLASLKKVKEEQVHYQAIADMWGPRVDALKTTDLDGRIKAFADRMKNERYSGTDGLKKAKRDLDEAKKLKADAEAQTKGYGSLKADVTGEINRAKDTLKGIDDLKKQDLDGALGDLKAGFSTEGITRGLIGEKWFAKIHSTLDMAQKARARLPKKKAGEKPEPPPARQGRDIPFPFRYNWPTFLLVKAGLSGATQDGLAYRGTLKDVTSDPGKLGRPAVLNVAGKKDASALDLSAVLDFTHDVSREQVKFSYTGFPLSGVKLGDMGGPVTIKDGRGTTTGDVAVKASALGGTIRFGAAPVSMDLALPADKAKDRLLSILRDTVSRLDALEVEIRLSGTLTAPGFALRTNLDDKIKEAVGQALQKEIDEMRGRAQERLNGLVDGEKKKLADQIDGKAGGALQKLGLKDKQVASAQTQIQKLVQDLTKKSTGSLLPAGDNGKPALPGNFKKLFKKK